MGIRRKFKYGSKRFKNFIRTLKKMEGQLVETDIEVDPAAVACGGFTGMWSRRNRYASDEDRWSGNAVP